MATSPTPSSRIHPTLMEHAGPPSVVPPQDAGLGTSGSQPPRSPSRGPSPLPYPPADSMPGHPSFPVPPPKQPGFDQATSGYPGSLQAPQPPAGPQRMPSVPPPAYNSVAPLPPYYGPGPTYGPGQQYPGVQPYYLPRQQQQQQTVYITGSPPPIYSSQRRITGTSTDEAVGAIVLSCFVVWCCGCIFGLVAFVLAIVACNKTNHPKKAHRLSVASYIISGIGIGVPILTMIIALSVVFGGGKSTATTPSPLSSCLYKVSGTCYTSRSSSYSRSSCSSFGGYYSSPYCYFSYSSGSCSTGYYISANSKCYTYLSSSKSSTSCSNLSGYYDYASGYCYYDSACSYYSYNGQCYRYISSSKTSSTCYSEGGYYSSPYCYYG